jgi:hypothetical protein
VIPGRVAERVVIFEPLSDTFLGRVVPDTPAISHMSHATNRHIPGVSRCHYWPQGSAISAKIGVSELTGFPVTRGQNAQLNQSPLPSDQERRHRPSRRLGSWGWRGAGVSSKSGQWGVSGSDGDRFVVLEEGTTTRSHGVDRPTREELGDVLEAAEPHT